MPGSIKFVILMSFLCLSSCSSDNVKRAAYGSLENIQRQQCYKEMGNNCEKRESYETYQDRRKELETTR